MSVLVVGLSHRTAPLSLLERVAAGSAQGYAAQGYAELSERLRAGEHVGEAVVLATCNRVEVYADVTKFHGGVADVGAELARHTGIDLDELTGHLYVHYEDRAVAHVFTVACGLDSMAVGEGQILGQLRDALRSAQSAGTAGRVLQQLLQQALRVGKRAHTETGLDRAGHSLVEAGLAHAEGRVGALAGAPAVVVGAGAMSALAAATLHRAGAGPITVVNRTPERARRLAAAVSGHALDWEQLPEALAGADVVVSCTGAVGHVLTEELLVASQATRGGRPQLVVDLALPRDVDPQAHGTPGLHVVDLDLLGRELADAELGADLSAVREIVADEVAGYLASRRAEAVAPTVVALRSHARDVVRVELERLDARMAAVADHQELDPRVRDEVVQTVHRVVEKLLHTPTVRVKQLAETPGGGSYAEALRELFDLDAEQVAAVSDATAPLGGPLDRPWREALVGPGPGGIL